MKKKLNYHLVPNNVFFKRVYEFNKDPNSSKKKLNTIQEIPISQTLLHIVIL